MLPKMILDGRFALEGAAGSGGMGTVYRAHERDTGEAVAIKVLHDPHDEPRRFLREIDVLAELSHPHIVDYIAHGTTPRGDAYLAMAWIEGPTLADVLADTGLTVRESTVAGNRLTDSRDLVVWYSPGNRFLGNRVERGRYGTHFMYSHDNEIRDNVYSGNVVGIFVMYSRHLRMEGNRLEHAAGAAGIGVGLKESGDLVFRDNQLLGNTVGLYIDTSPLDRTEHNRFHGNRLSFHDRAIVFHGTVDRNHFVENALADNRVQVVLEGRGDARAAEWRGNHWDDYVGYDLDGDGVGDVPYELRSLANEWIGRIPALAFFRGSAALTAVEWLGKALPLFRPTTLLVDPAPRMQRPMDLAVAD
ncbi:MAG: NosD domain-containing protein [Myxococcota bacterium]